MNWALFEQLDHMRRAQGLVLDAAGIGPLEAAYRVVNRRPGVNLRRYEDGSERGALLLIVPAPIKRPYIWDLAPEVSAVRRCLATGARVFLADWQPAPAEFGLADYAERLILDCLDAAGGEPAILLGHSLGGLFAAIFAALHPERVRGLVLLASPLHFGADARAFSRMAAELDPHDLPDSLPGSYLIPLICAGTCRSSAGRWTNLRCRAAWSPSSSRSSCARTASRREASKSTVVAPRRRDSRRLCYAWSTRIAA